MSMELQFNPLCNFRLKKLESKLVNITIIVKQKMMKCAVRNGADFDVQF